MAINGLTGKRPPQVIDQFPFTRRIQGRARLVQDQDFGLGQERSRNGDALTLSGRKSQTAFSRNRVQTLRQAAKKFRQAGRMRSLLHGYTATKGFA